MSLTTAASKFDQEVRALGLNQQRRSNREHVHPSLDRQGLHHIFIYRENNPAAHLSAIRKQSSQ
jgi:hypothetical protein